MSEKIKKVIPNIFSLLNGTVSFLMLAFYTSGMWHQYPDSFKYLIYGILLCIFFDILDGFFARRPGTKDRAVKCKFNTSS